MPRRHPAGVHRSGGGIQVETDENTRLTGEALTDTRRVGEMMEDSLGTMAHLMEAMHTIDQHAGEITKVIRVIDDIAFQADILALNAAVEAARTGPHGKGFAVVADEVCNLVSKSAEVTKETAALIARSSESVGEGKALVEEVNERLKAVGQLAESNATAIGQMSEASGRQSASMAEVIGVITHLSGVVQTNSATAKETAASAEEMSAQAGALDGAVANFRLREGQCQLPALEQGAS